MKSLSWFDQRWRAGFAVSWLLSLFTTKSKRSVNLVSHLTSQVDSDKPTLFPFMNVSLIICTYNRCESLLKTLESVAASVLPPSIEWEVVVVDNNSQDQTSAAVEEFSDRHPGRFRYLFEPTQGLSNARNAGILAAQGEVIAFTDDDVIVHPSWLLNLTRPFLERSWAGAGGRVLPFQGVVLPPWLSLSPPYDLGGRVAALFDQGGEPKELNLPPYGANMAFRREMFQKYGHFRRDLGRRPDSLIGGEETEFGMRLIAARERLFYKPSAIVYHPVPEERLTKEYLFRGPSISAAQ